MSDDFKVVRTREEYLGMIALFKTIGINAIFGGTKGDGFWLQNAATGETITDPLNRSGNPAFWMWDDAYELWCKERIEAEFRYQRSLA